MQRIAPALVLAILGATIRAEGQTAIPVWQVAGKPVATIGISEGDVTRELANVSSAHRLPGGNIVLANGKPLEVRLYSPAGSLLRTIGREGEGPGEFRTQVQVFGLPADSILTFTSGNARWAVFTADGKLVREWPSGVHEWSRDVMIYRGAFAHRRDSTPSICVRAAIDRLPATTVVLREIVPDAAGRFWVRDAGAAEWTVHTLTGKIVGRVTLPADAELFEAANGFVLLKRRDADDVERIEAWRVVMPAAPRAGADPCRQAPDSVAFPASGVTLARMKTDLRNLQTAAQKIFDDTHAWPRAVGDFHYTMSTGANLEPRMLMSNAHGWGAMIIDHTAGFYCVTFVHDGWIPGWTSGYIACAPVETTRSR
jgi:hypothetical protein